jgi:hypothetical protein
MISTIYAKGGTPINRNAFAVFGYKKAKFKKGRKKKSIYAPTAKKLLPNQIGQITRCIAKENLRL